jgi:hypothetical protein
LRAINSFHRLAAVGVLFSLLVLPTPALAGSETLKRAFGNIVQGPIDVVLSPITAGIVQYRNMTNIDDSTGVRVFYFLPGYVWLVGIHAAASVLRTLAGIFELLPGLVLVFTDAEMDPMFAPSEKSEGVIWDFPTTVMDFKIGLDYTAAPF